SATDRAALKQKLGAIGSFLIDWAKTYDKTIEGKKTWDGKQQQDTEEGFGRLDALNRIGNQVFSQDLAMSGVKGFEKNLHAQDAPVSYPAIWTVPWFKFAQYDASIEQPLIRNAGEALGVTALLNLSDAY
ncbi:cytochrome C, partial [Herbaspirillum sp. HC18]